MQVFPYTNGIIQDLKGEVSQGHILLLAVIKQGWLLLSSSKVWKCEASPAVDSGSPFPDSLCQEPVG